MKDKHSRRTFLNNLSKVAVTTASLPVITNVATLPEQQKEQEDFKFLTAPYLQDLNNNSVSVMFITNQNAYSWVEYGENDFAQKAVTLSDGFVAANNTLNSIRITNLKPGKSYRYKILSRPILKFEPYEQVLGDPIEMRGGTFKTPLKIEKKVSCLILNDIHDRPNSIRELLANCKDFNFDFVALNGDTLSHLENEQQLISNLIEPCTQLFASEKPFLMIRGNHETRGKFARQLKDYFKYNNGEYFYSFKQGPVHWIVLDTGEDKEDNHPVYSGLVSFDTHREKQAAWLEQELQKPEFLNCKYRLVLMHIPFFHSDNWHGTTHCKKLFHPIFEKYKISMAISGHTHQYGLYKPNKEHSYPIVIGGGPQNGNRTIIQIKADEQVLKMKMILDNGDLIGNYSVKSE